MKTKDILQICNESMDYGMTSVIAEITDAIEDLLLGKPVNKSGLDEVTKFMKETKISRADAQEVSKQVTIAMKRALRNYL